MDFKMKKILQKILITCGILAILFTPILPLQSSAFATDANNNVNVSSCRYFLGMPAWDCNVGLTDWNKDNMAQKIWTIVANIFTDISIIAVYLVIGYVMYGGYLYVFSSGDPSKVAAGKKTLSRAFIGLAIVMLSSVILNAIRVALGVNLVSSCLASGNCNATQASADATNMVVSVIHWAIGVAGVVSAIFVVIGGVGYVTSSGDSAKLQKAKTTIIYALIGLAIVALAEVLTAFVSNMIKDANKTSSINEITIAKELHEKNY